MRYKENKATYSKARRKRGRNVKKDRQKKIYNIYNHKKEEREIKKERQKTKRDMKRQIMKDNERKIERERGVIAVVRF
jgi:hypothetical protein